MKTPRAAMNLFINGLSIGTGGGYTVGREIARHVALARPEWRVTLGLITGHKLQKEFESETLPTNVELLWTPTEGADPRWRSRYERHQLAPDLDKKGCNAVLQLNGMVIPGLQAPTLAHFQDPFPYRSEAWVSWRERVAAWFKRRANRRALREAAVCGWTSKYLEDLVCDWHGVRPRRSIVFYNGVPEEWVDRSRGELSPLGSRPLRIVTVSNVWPYKRQSLVIEALALLRKRPGLEGLEYDILGAGSEDYYQELRSLANRLGVGDAVHVEGRVSDERVEEAFASSRAMPLMSVCESFGIPMVEAMASGTPVVAADCCALPEVAGDAAAITPVDDVKQLANQLEKVLTDPATAERLRKAGIRRVSDFRWSAIGTRMAEVIDEIAAAKTV